MVDARRRTAVSLMRAAGAVCLLSVAPLAVRPTAAGQPATRPAGAEDAGPSSRPASPERTWLEEITITAMRAAVESFTAPYTVDTVNLSDFSRQRLYRSTTKALTDTPGVMVQKTAHAQGSPYIRGLTSYHTLLLVDGVRLNNSIFRAGPNQYWNLVDPAAVERMEVVKGPSSVLYGSDAVGGTVNTVMRSPEGVGTSGWFRQAFYRYATAERSHVVRGEVNAVIDRLGVLAGGTWRDFGDVDGGRFVGPQPHTGYSDCAGDIKVVYQPDRHTTVTTASYNLYQDDAWRTHKTASGISWEGTTVGNEIGRVLDQAHSLTYGRFQRRNLGTFIDSVDLTLSCQRMTERRWRLRNNGRRDRQGFDVDTYGLGLQLGSPVPVGALTYGVEWYHDEVESFRKDWNADGSLRSVSIQGPVGDDASYDLFGLYCQYLIPVGKRAEVTLGGRYNYARAAADKVADLDTGGIMSVTEDWEALVGSARLSWFLDDAERVNLFGGVSQGFRAPNLSDLTRLDSARTNEAETPSPGLDPEQFISYELGLKVKEGRFSAQAAGYYTDIRDMIVRTPTGQVIPRGIEVTKQNAGDGGLCGVEVEARYRFLPQWTAFGDFTYMYGEVDTYPTPAPEKRSEPLDRIMPPTGRAGLRWDSADKRLWVEGVCTVAARADKLSTRDRGDTQRIPPGGTPSYMIFDVRGGWRVNDGLEVWLGVENLTNRDYRIHGSGVNEPGINLKIGARVRF